MNILNTLERKFGQYAIQNLTLYLIGGQVLAYLLSLSNPLWATMFHLEGQLILGGQWWRILTFVFSPPGGSPLFVVLAWYFSYIFGTALESVWGPFRYLMYLFIGVVATACCAFLFPTLPISNSFIFSSLFVAFCYLFPEYTVLVFFVLPVKMKWLGIVAWLGILGSFLGGSTDVKVLIVFSLANFVLFFGRDIFDALMSRSKQVKEERLSPSESYMTCEVCHKTEHDKKIFSYCHTCKPETMYCQDHIHDHTHKKNLQSTRHKPIVSN